MKIYNTLTGKKEPLTPINPGQIKMYTCGQTVYNDIHIGNARFYVAFDAIRRYLEYKDYEVIYIQNFTDIEDKIIQRAADEGCATHELAEKYIQRTLEDLDSLHVRHATIHPKATGEIPEIIAMIKRLVQGGHAYHKNGSVYFNTANAQGYGKLSRKKIEDLISGARVEVDTDKQNATDFVLWKPAKPGEPYWESPWGQGRPGWHIECSAMALKYLGEEIDIHGGASDLIFPHHENEIAQSEAANGKNFARYWMHCGILTVNHKKMGKSAGNFQTLREVAQRFPYDVIRFYLVSGHYRAPMEFTDEVIEAAKQGLNRIKNCHRNLTHAEKTAQSSTRTPIQQEVNQYIQAFETAMEDDFNAADAVTAIYELVTFTNKQIPTISKENAQYLREKLELLCGLLGIVADTDTDTDTVTLTDEEVEALIAARTAARIAKNFAESDRIRDELASKGIILEDTRGGVRWHRA
ncbi:MAG: cysteine--tRNA ligase [Defluviitaleaceae bacterium]|nr:cysteine--tRNA ligase [Defluviitaleaceae bacterium]